MSGARRAAGKTPLPGEASGLEIRLFGPMEVRVGPRPLPRLRTRKGMWLLALLALRAERDVDRGWLAGTLWPDDDEADARRSLRQSLHDLRLALGPEAWRLSSGSTQTLRLDISALDVDALAFDSTIVQGDPASMKSAVELYRGPLLEDCAEEWVLEERLRREQAHLGALQSLASAAAARGDHTEAANCLRIAVAVEPLREDLQRALMDALVKNGDSAGALLVYRELRALLLREMSIEPDQATTELFRQIRDDRRIQATVGYSKTGTTGPRAALPASSRRLPIPLTELIGREEAIREVAELLTRARLATLTGTGGIGKTRLAIEVATLLKDDFAGGAHFVPFAGLTGSANVEDAIRDALGLSPGGVLETTIELLLRNIGDLPLLLVMDNCEHLLARCAMVADSLLGRCGGLRILATSRQALGLVGEVVWQVPSLELPPKRAGASDDEKADRIASYAAVKLFSERARAAASSFKITEANAGSVVEVCRSLDGIPLAIELAAARTRSLSAAQIAARLSDRFRLLTRGSRTAPNRQQTLRAAMDWSYDVLNNQERILLRRLSVFAGGWTLEAAEKVCGLGPETLDILDQVVGKSLVVADTAGPDARFSFLETIRQYASERLDESGERLAFEKAHQDHFLSLAEKARPNLVSAASSEWLARLDAEHDNFREALAHLRDDPNGGEPGLVLCVALFQFLDRRGHWMEGRECYRAALAHPGAHARTIERAKAANCAGLLCWRQGDCDAARALFNEAIEIFRELREQAAIAGPLHNLALLANWRGEYSEACALLDEALAINRKSGNRAWEGHNLQTLGSIAHHQTDYDSAKNFARESLALGRALGDRDGVATALTSVAIAEMRQGDLTAAGNHFEEALAIRRSTGNKGGIANVLVNFADLDYETGDYEEAQSLLEECFSLSREVGDQRVAAFALETSARLANKLGQPSRAAELFGAAQALRAAINLPLTPAGSADVNGTLGAVQTALGVKKMSRHLAMGREMILEAAVELAIENERFLGSSAGSAVLPTRAESDGAAVHHGVRRVPQPIE